MIEFDYSKLDSAVVQQYLRRNSVVLISNFVNDNYRIKSFIESLGVPLYESRNVDEGIIFEVKISKYKDCYQSKAQSSHKFELHTDCSDYMDVPNAVALYCVNQSKIGGETYMLNVVKLIDSIGQEMFNDLTRIKWNFNGVKAEILSLDKCVRYNREIIEISHPICNKEDELLDYLDKMFSESAFVLKLKPRQMLIFRNDKYLHGRNSFTDDSNRLLKRIRFSL